MNLDGINEVNYIPSLAERKGIGSGGTTDVKNHCRRGRKNSRKDLQRSKLFQFAVGAGETFGLFGLQVMGFHFFR